MRNARYFLLAAGLLAILTAFVAGCGDKSVATVNGETITKEEFFTRLERYQFQIPPQAAQQPVTTPQAGPSCLNDLINEKLVAQIAKDKGVTPTEEQINSKIDILKKEGQMKQMLATGLTEEDIKKQLWNRQAYLNIVAKGETVSDKEAKDIYDAINKESDQFRQPEKVQIGLISHKDKKNIDNAAKLVKSGQEFSTVAMKLSDDPATKQTGGVAGWLARNDTRIPEVVRATAWKLKKGTVSEPFQIKDDPGKKWYIIKAIDKRPARTQTFVMVKNTLKEELRFRKGSSKVDFPKVLESYRKKAKIEVNDKKYANLIKEDKAAEPK